MEQSDRSSDSEEYDKHIEALAPDQDLFEYYDDDVIFAASDARTTTRRMLSNGLSARMDRKKYRQ